MLRKKKKRCLRRDRSWPGGKKKKKGVWGKWKTRMINFAVLGISPLSTVLHRETKRTFSQLLEPGQHFFWWDSFGESWKGVNLQWEVRHLGKKKRQGKARSLCNPFLYLYVWGFMKLSGCSPECQGSTGTLSLDVFRQVLHGQLLRVLWREIPMFGS